MADPSVTAGWEHLQPPPTVSTPETAEIVETAETAQTVEITDTEEIIRIGKVVRAAKKKLEAHVMEIEFKIHRFPANLRRFGKDMDYRAPRIVAIGPYYHRKSKLQAMEEVKRMAVYYFFEGLAKTRELRGYYADEVYEKIRPVAREVRGCYADAGKLKGITDDDFAAMMFFDGCFLVQCLDTIFFGGPPPFASVISSKGIGSILRDMMLLENQIPWPVLQLLTAIWPKRMWDVFIARLISGFCVSWSREEQSVIIDEDFKPPHLLGLIHFHQVRSSYVKKESRLCSKYIIGFLRKLSCRSRKKAPMAAAVPRIVFLPREKRVDELTTSAAELAEIGVKLTPSGTSKFSDMEVVRGPLFATLSLAPLLLDDLTACWLVNMVAFEQCRGALYRPIYPVNSYLSVMAQLINRDDDVRALHGKRIVHTIFDDNQTLKFFKCLAPHLTEGYSYLDIFRGLHEYKQKRWVWIAIYKFLYKNATTIAKVLSIVGVLVPIFKALFSLKHHHP